MCRMIQIAKRGSKTPVPRFLTQKYVSSCSDFRRLVQNEPKHLERWAEHGTILLLRRALELIADGFVAGITHHILSMLQAFFPLQSTLHLWLLASRNFDQNPFFPFSDFADPNSLLEPASVCLRRLGLGGRTNFS